MRWTIIAFLLPAALLGCTDPTVVVQGNVRADVAEDAPPFAGARLTLLNESGKKSLGTAKANAKGRFSAEIPGGITFHAIVDGDDHVPAAFSGVSGLNETFEVNEGVLHGLSQAEWDWWTTAFAGCPGVGEGGAVIGIARTLELVDDNGEHPSVNTGLAELYDPVKDEVVAQACYLDPETLTYDPEAGFTGESGLFGIFGVEEGDYVLSMGLEVYENSYTWDDTVVYVPDGGAAPRFPAWVHFPI